jgi:hypothetical protein
VRENEKEKAARKLKLKFNVRREKIFTLTHIKAAGIIVMYVSASESQATM